MLCLKRESAPECVTLLPKIIMAGLWPGLPARQAFDAGRDAIRTTAFLWLLGKMAERRGWPASVCRVRVGFLVGGASLPRAPDAGLLVLRSEGSLR